MAELSDERARAEAEANAELDRRRDAARVEFLRSWVEQNGVAIVASTLRVAESDIGEVVESGDLLEESPAYRAVEGWMAGTGYGELWDGGAEGGGKGGEDEAVSSVGYPPLAEVFGRGKEGVTDGRALYLMQQYEESGGDLAIAQDMVGLSRNQFMQAARRIRAGGALDGRIADLIDARIEKLRVARGGAVDAETAGDSEAPGVSGAKPGGGEVGGEGGAAAGDVDGVEARAQGAPSPAGSTRAGAGIRRAVGQGGGEGSADMSSGTSGEDSEAESAARQATGVVGAVRLPTVVRHEAYPDEDEFYGEEVARVARRWRANWVALQVYRQRPQYGYHYRFQKRVLELELELMETHGLTLPPDEVEITGVQREDAIRWRRQRLVELVSMVAAEVGEGRAPEYIAPYPELRSGGGWWGRWRRGRRELGESESGTVARVSGGKRSFAGGGRWHPLPWPELRSGEVEARVARVNLRRPDAERSASVDAPVDVSQRSSQGMGWTSEEMSGRVSEPVVEQARRGWFGWLKR